MRNSRSFLRVNWWSQESLFNFLGRLITAQNGSCGKEIRSRIARAKNAFTKRKELLTNCLQPLTEEENIVQDLGLESLRVGDVTHLTTVFQTSSTRYMILVSFFDHCFNLEKNLKAICKSAPHHLRDAAMQWIRKYLTEDSAKCVLHAFVTSE